MLFLKYLFLLLIIFLSIAETTTTPKKNNNNCLKQGRSIKKCFGTERRKKKCLYYRWLDLDGLCPEPFIGCQKRTTCRFPCQSQCEGTSMCKWEKGVCRNLRRRKSLEIIT